MNQEAVHLLAISGSLRGASSNSKLLHAIGALLPDNVSCEIYAGIGELPHFNPDLDNDDPPDSVRAFRQTVKTADGVLLCTPEYANGVPGVLKNALDWLVSSGEFVYKPTAVVTASPNPRGGNHANESLVLTLTMMTADIVEGGAVTLPFVVSAKFGENGEITDPDMISRLSPLLQSLADAMDRKKQAITE
ncbi:NADPH-dependent FMN reductase [Paenibacillus kobensis]|uniref:NADPH-dependent FMN reductase n=1 Tax=Paenibacillus kobensis TaxID=59841 RepID=UPI000FDC6CCF|nr:NADPH-dependent FMN reductase [Paenibacillus kobensis]